MINFKLLSLHNPLNSWTKADSEELVALYLMDYYETLDDYYLQEALQIAKDDGVSFQTVNNRVRLQLD